MLAWKWRNSAVHADGPTSSVRSLRDVAGRRFFIDTTEHWKRRASLRGPSVHHSEAARFIRKATGTVGSSSFCLATCSLHQSVSSRQFSSVPKWVNWPSRRNRGRRRRAPSPPSPTWPHRRSRRAPVRCRSDRIVRRSALIRLGPVDHSRPDRHDERERAANAKSASQTISYKDQQWVGRPVVAATMSVGEGNAWTVLRSVCSASPSCR
jgi:hypothetical protein